MNVAFPAIVAFLLIVPGLIYLTIRPNLSVGLPPRPPAPLSIEAVVVVVSSGVLHLIWYVVAGWVSRCCGWQLSPRSALIFLSGHSSGFDTDYVAAINSVANFPWQVTVYFLGLYLFSAIAAWRLGPTIDPLFIHIGLLPDRQALSDEWQKFVVTDDGTLTTVATVVDLGGVAYLYIGKLVELYFAPDTQALDRFALEDVWRRKLADDKPPATAAQSSGGSGVKRPAEQIIADQWHSVEGNLFIIRYSDAKTINIRYWRPDQ